MNAARVNTGFNQFEIDQLKHVPSNLNDLKCKIDISDIEELAAVPVDLIQLNNLIKDDAVKKYEYNVKIKNIEDEISDITKLATKTTLNAKKSEVKSKIHSFTN